jgi:hypothetical protein
VLVAGSAVFDSKEGISAAIQSLLESCAAAKAVTSEE